MHVSNTCNVTRLLSPELVVFSVLCFAASVGERGQGDEVLSEKRRPSSISSFIR